MALRSAPVQDAAALVVAVHGSALRLLAMKTGRHFTGLEQASRSCSMLPSRLKKRLVVVDHAFSLIRHITEPSVGQSLAELDAAIESETLDPQLDKQEATQELLEDALLRRTDQRWALPTGPSRPLR